MRTTHLPAAACVLVVFCVLLARADDADAANYDESKVPDYALPDPLTLADGTKVDDAETWRTKRRPEIIELFREYVYGRAPGKPSAMRFRVLEAAGKALDGKAIRRQVRIDLTGKPDGPGIDLLIYLPAGATKPAPAFMTLNFQGNHSIEPDPGIRLASSWLPGRRKGVKDNRATEAARGVASDRWPAELIVSAGYALATAYYGDIDPDYHDRFRNGMHALYDDKDDKKRPGDAWGSIAAWAWGLSRAMDYLAGDEDIDGERVAVMGHSRLGKTALWAGAEDQRFAIVISNNSGCGGAALSRREFGETVARINRSFPHWFCRTFHAYGTKVNELPVDQHMLIALAAPRPVYVASAEGDRWADPRGEFLSCVGADPVYRLLETEGLPAKKMPEVGKPLHGRIGYHIRTGRHGVTDFDWRQYIEFANKHYGREKP